MNATGRAKILSCTVQGEHLRSAYDCDTKNNTCGHMVGALSDMIDRFREVPDNVKDYFVNTSMPNEWNDDNEQLYLCYQLYKLWWLDQDIEQRGQEAPVQLIQAGRNVASHPGSDKKYVITFLNPLEDVKCFYIWYPELDNTPWIWTQGYQEVKTPEEFCSMFPQILHNTFELEYCDVTFTKNGYDTGGNNHFTPFASGVHKGLEKYGVITGPDYSLTIPHLSYRDGVHRMGMFANKQRFREIRFQDGYFYLGKYKFIQQDGVWYPSRYYHFPKSLNDHTWRYIESRALFFENTRPCISSHRRNQ